MAGIHIYKKIQRKYAILIAINAKIKNNRMFQCK